MDSILDALGYVGDLLAKPGRAVRGVLTGNAREGLAALPFSDSLGLTDKSQAVDGRGLLSALGIDAGDGTMGDVAGMGAELATDPLSYLGGAALGRAGKLFANAGLGRGAGVSTKVGAGAGDIFDLVSPGEREMAKLAPGNLGRQSAVAAAEEAAPTAARGGLAEALHDPVLDDIPVVPPPLHELPPVDSYFAHIGYGPDAAHHGIPDDILMDKGPLEGFRASLTGWDNALDDLDRLSPQARLNLTGNELETNIPFGAPHTQHVPPSMEGGLWQEAMGRRLADLNALTELTHAGFPQELLDLAQAQAGRLSGLSTGRRYESAASVAVQDLLNGRMRPSDVPQMMQDIFPHIPLDERKLRAMAAQIQKDELLGRITGNIGEHVPAGMHPDDAMQLYVPDWLRTRMEMALDRDNYPEIEPGILSDMLRNPPTNNPWGDHIRLAQDLLERVSGHRTPYPIPRPPTRG